jgi:hypothetical protein
MYFVTYKIEGFEEEKKAGPYTAEEVAYQKNDISSYEGVYDVDIISKEDKLWQG